MPPTTENEPQNGVRNGESHAQVTRTVRRARVEAVQALRLIGAQFTDIQKHAAENNWKVGAQTLRGYIADSDKILHRQYEKSRRRNIEMHTARVEGLYARCLAVSDLRSALACLKELAETKGIYPKKKMQPGIPMGPVVLQITEQVVEPKRLPKPVETIDQPMPTSETWAQTSGEPDASSNP